MPLKINSNFDAGQAATLNKWADYIETQLHASNKKIFRVANTAVANIPPAAVSTSGVTDGLTHGDPVWEYDPGYIILRDDFHGNLNSASVTGGTTYQNIGQLGWVLLGGFATTGPNGPLGGVPPNLGIYSWANNSVVSAAGWLTLSGSGGFSNSNFSQLSWALFEKPSWKMTFVFKVETANIPGQRTFITAQKSLYVGLSGPTLGALSTNNVSRPDQFIGVRFDTSTSAPSIGDTFFTLEVVANQTTSGVFTRHNTQGTTFVTNVAPVAGTWHRLDIICNTAGKVTLVLDGSSTNTLTASVPTYSFTTTVTGSSTGTPTFGGAQLNWSSTQGVWNSGSSVTVSGFTAGRAGLNGTFQLMGAEDLFVLYNLNSNIASGSDTVTLSGYPSWTPICTFGNDDTAAPSTDNALFCIDYWAFVWNPNLGPTPPGTPIATNPRYF
jgi:hypothetical protein